MTLMNLIHRVASSVLEVSVPIEEPVGCLGKSRWGHIWEFPRQVLTDCWREFLIEILLKYVLQCQIANLLQHVGPHVFWCPSVAFEVAED